MNSSSRNKIKQKNPNARSPDIFSLLGFDIFMLTALFIVIKCTCIICSFYLQVRTQDFIFRFRISKVSGGMLFANFLILQYFRGLLLQLFTIWAIHLAFSLLGCLGY